MMMIDRDTRRALRFFPRVEGIKLVSVVFDSHDTLYVGRSGKPLGFCILTIPFTFKTSFPRRSAFDSPILDALFTVQDEPKHSREEHKDGFSAELPTDMDNPGYWFDDSKVGLERVGRYISKQEWQELAHGANAAYKTHAATSNGFVRNFSAHLASVSAHSCAMAVSWTHGGQRELMTSKSYLSRKSSRGAVLVLYIFVPREANLIWWDGLRDFGENTGFTTSVGYEMTSSHSEYYFDTNASKRKPSWNNN